jgi:hypothetical protein
LFQNLRLQTVKKTLLRQKKPLFWRRAECRCRLTRLIWGGAVIAPSL